MPTVSAIVCLAAKLFSCQDMEVKVVDGDTIRLGRESIRFVRINAPETSKPACEREKALGELATQRVAQLVSSAGQVVIDRKGRDQYGRTLAAVKVDGRDIGDILMSEGLARRWEKRFRPGLDRWCA